MVMAVGTGEVFGWILFFIIITILFFAAFGGSEYNEQSIEEYMERITKEEKRRNT
jgi:hypothetical protein